MSTGLAQMLDLAANTIRDRQRDARARSERVVARQRRRQAKARRRAS
jgi:hypothetical protein